MTTIGPTSPDERDLMRSLYEGNVSALAEIYERTAPVLYALALRIVGVRERAACVLEDLFEEIWRDRARWGSGASGPSSPPSPLSPSFPASPFSGEIPLVAWIARCRELALAQIGPEPGAPAAADFSESPGGYGAAWPALATLPDRDRRALEEAYFRGTPAREIAAMIGAPTTDAGIILRSALARFRDYADESTDEAEPAVAQAGCAS